MGRKRRALWITLVALAVTTTPAHGRVAMQAPPDGPRQGDGRFVFVACVGKKGAYTRCNAFAPPEGVFEQSGETVTRLTRVDSMKRWLVWSPDASHFAFSAPYGLSADADCPAYQAPVTGRARTVLENDGWSCIAPADWSPGGRWILLNFSYFEGGSNLFRVRPDGSDLRRITCFMHPAASGTSGGFFTEGGRKVIFAASNADGLNGIYSINADGTHQRLLHEATTYDFDLSPDQSTLAFASVPENGASGEIYAMAVDGRDLRRLTFNDVHERGVAFSPDGTKIAYGAAERYGTRPVAISVVDLETGEATNVALPGGTRLAESDFRLVWSPDGRRVAFEGVTVESNRHAVYWSDLASGVTARGTDYFPELSLWGWLTTRTGHEIDPGAKGDR